MNIVIYDAKTDNPVEGRIKDATTEELPDIHKGWRFDFVKMYLKVLNIAKKKLANAFEMRDSNLQKYLTGERKLNPDIVLKLRHYEKYSYTRIVADEEITY